MSALPKPNNESTVAARRQQLLADGYRIVPCKGKFPEGFKGWQNLRASASHVENWESSFPEHRNTGALCGELVAIDIDILRPDLAEAIANMVRELPGGAAAPCRVGQAPKSMFMFRTTEPREKSVTDWFRIDGQDQRIEIMGAGQQVIVDGIHPNTGKPYTWDRELQPFDSLPTIDWSSLERMLGDAAALLAEHAEQRKPAPRPRRSANDNVGDNFFRRVNQAALDNLDAWVPALELPKTHRQADGFRAVCAWRGVRNANLSFHHNGITDWGSGETHTAIDVVEKAGHADGPASAASWLCERLGKTREELGWIDKGAPMLPTPDAIAKLVAKKSITTAAVNPFTPEALGGLMGSIAEWVLNTSRRKSPELATMAAIAFMSAFYGRRVVGPTGCGVNLYLAGIAGPGFGKEAPLQRLVKALQDSGMAYLVGAGEVSSSSAIEKIMRRKPVVVKPWDEIGDVLEAINATGPGNWASTIRKAMLELYSKSTGVWFGKETTDEERMGEPIHCPSLTIVGTSTPTRFYGGLSEKNLSDGFVARMIFIAPAKRPARAQPKDNGLKLPKELRRAIEKAQADFKWPKRVGDAENQWRVAAVEPAMIEVPWADAAAEKAWIAIEDWQEAEIDKDESRDGMLGRAAENAIRLATLRALSRDAAKPMVNVEDVEWARAVVLSSIDAVDAGVDKFMTSSKFEDLCRSILGALRSSGGKLYRAELLKRRGVRGADNRLFEEALKRLQETGDIEKTDGRTLTLTETGQRN